MDTDAAALAGSDGVSIHSGFPNPAEAATGQSTPLALDLNRLLVQHPSSTYVFKVAGHSWEHLGIFDGDIALIDRALQPRSKDLIIAWQTSGFRFRRWERLQADDTLWGVVSVMIHPYQLKGMVVSS